jgi:hypothetical protein
MQKEVNNFLNKNRKPTKTDYVLAKAYYPLLIDIVKNQQEVTFQQFVENAKSKYTQIKEVQSAIPVTTGRRFEYIRIFTIRENLPDLSAWIVSKKGTNSEAYLADFNPVLERENTTKIDWSSYDEKWQQYLEKLNKETLILKKRTEKEALELMSKHAKLLEEKIKALVPNPQKLKYSSLVSIYREPIRQDLIDGKDVDESFDDAIFDVKTE